MVVSTESTTIAVITPVFIAGQQPSALLKVALPPNVTPWSVHSAVSDALGGTTSFVLCDAAGQDVSAVLAAAAFTSPLELLAVGCLPSAVPTAASLVPLSAALDGVAPQCTEDAAAASAARWGFRGDASSVSTGVATTLAALHLLSDAEPVVRDRFVQWWRGAFVQLPTAAAAWAAGIEAVRTQAPVSGTLRVFLAGMLHEWLAAALPSVTLPEEYALYSALPLAAALGHTLELGVPPAGTAATTKGPVITPTGVNLRLNQLDDLVAAVFDAIPELCACPGEVLDDVDGAVLAVVRADGPDRPPRLVYARPGAPSLVPDECCGVEELKTWLGPVQGRGTSKKPLLGQIDVLVIDSSGSMGCTAFADDPVTKRSDAVQVLFCAFLDCLTDAEVQHAVGVVSFVNGTAAVRSEITDNLAELCDGPSVSSLREGIEPQGTTPLWDSIATAVDLALQYRSRRAREPGCEELAKTPIRIFVLSDGVDNASKMNVYRVAMLLQQHHVVLDAMCLGDVDDKPLRCVANSSSGCMFEFADLVEGAGLLGTAGVLALVKRANGGLLSGLQAGSRGVVNDAKSLYRFSDLAEYPRIRNPLLMEEVLMRIQDRQAKTANCNGQSVPTPPKKKAPLAIRCKKRIAKELHALVHKGCNNGFYDVDKYDEVNHPLSIGVSIYGPSQTPYAKGIFKVSFELTENFPFSAPVTVFKTRLYHPNISADGGICLDVLGSNWSPSLTIKSLVMSLHALLCEPNADDPLVPEAAALYRVDRKAYEAKAREWVALYAK